VSIQIFDKQNALEIDHGAVKNLVQSTLHYLQEPFFELSIQFVDVPKICALHKKYFNDPNPTDCISFPMDPKGAPQRVLGEVFVCTQVAIDQSKEQKTSPLFEISLYVIHGLLHLIGFHDHTEKMKEKQDECVDRAKSLNLLLSN